MKIGLQLPEVEREVRWAELRDIAVTAEDAGFHSVWVGDHLLYRNPGEAAKGPWEVWTVLSALAEATRRVQLGPLVAATAFHSPAMLAKKAATLDEISGGRLLLALGAGWNEVEFRAFGFAYDHRVSRFEEALTIICTLMREGAIDFQGRYYTARDCELLPRGPRPNGPPLILGAKGPRMLRIGLPHVDGWNAWHSVFENKLDGLIPLLRKIDQACVDAGRRPEDVERHVTALVALPGATGRMAGDAEKRSVIPISGEPEVLANTLTDYAKQGVAHVQLVLDPITADSVEQIAPVLALMRARVPE